MENLGAMAYSRYTGFCKITDRDVLELHCSSGKGSFFNLQAKSADISFFSSQKPMIWVLIKSASAMLFQGEIIALVKALFSIQKH